MSFIFNIKNDSKIDSNSNMEKQKRQNLLVLTKNDENLIDNGRMILSLLLKKDNKENKRDSIKTADTHFLMTKIIDYKLEDIKKFDEMNNSFSDISDFDLEIEDDENKSEFNSSEDENSDCDAEEIFSKKKKKKNKNDFKFKIEIDKEYEEIVKNLNIKKNL